LLDIIGTFRDWIFFREYSVETSRVILKYIIQVKVTPNFENTLTRENKWGLIILCMSIWHVLSGTAAEHLPQTGIANRTARACQWISLTLYVPNYVAYNFWSKSNFIKLNQVLTTFQNRMYIVFGQSWTFQS
jgi:hypothetical protein